ncbi:FecR family protein [Parabacteroides goldsteinii]|uniref:FecR family protein n=1 Tax=Parabacteroides goldsteinii TaxID=328812 RepID=UPI0025713104|nr:FecR family protein [Parabacteroides goldsteinii]
MEQEQKDVLLYDYLSGELSLKEMEDVEAWIEESEANRTYFAEFRREFLRMRWGMRSGLIKGTAVLMKRRIRMRVLRRLSVWMAAVCVLSLGSFYMLNSLQKEMPLETVSGVWGERQAQLILSSGESVVLNGNDCQLTEANGMTIFIDTNGAVNYAVSGEEQTELLYNTVITPLGGEYSIVLADGTRVWLNAGTEFRYPVSFTENRREVYLSGEAYFEVRQDKNKPFVVWTGEVQIEVLGTAFNVNSYNSDRVEAVLVEGSVNVSNVTDKINLRPGQRGTVLKSEREIRVDEVDVYVYTAWKDGNFVFENQTLENIMEQLSRWYDVDVFYTREAARQECLSGEMTRYREIRSLLYYFEQISEVRFEIKGRTIVVK